MLPVAHSRQMAIKELNAMLSTFVSMGNDLFFCSVDIPNFFMIRKTKQLQKVSLQAQKYLLWSCGGRSSPLKALNSFLLLIEILLHGEGVTKPQVFQLKY
jgi:hypothetical protein